MMMNVGGGGGDDIGGGGVTIRTQMKYFTSTHISSFKSQATSVTHYGTWSTSRAWTSPTARKSLVSFLELSFGEMQFLLS